MSCFSARKCSSRKYSSNCSEVPLTLRADRNSTYTRNKCTCLYRCTLKYPWNSDIDVCNKNMRHMMVFEQLRTHCRHLQLAAKITKTAPTAHARRIHIREFRYLKVLVTPVWANFWASETSTMYGEHTKNTRLSFLLRHDKRRTEVGAEGANGGLREFMAPR